MSRHNIRLLGWFSFFLDLRFYVAVLVIYFARVTGSYALALSVLAVTMVTAALLDVPLGLLSDLLGRRRTILIGGLFGVVATVLYAIGGSFLVLAFGGLAEGVARACYSGNTEALLYESLAEDGRQTEYAKYTGRISSMSQGALALCALLGSIIAAQSLSVVMWLSVGPQVLVMWTIFQLRDAHEGPWQRKSAGHHLSQSLSVFRSNKALRLISASDILGFALGEAGFQFTPVFVSSLWPLWAIGIWSTLSHAGGFLGYRFSEVFVRPDREVGTLIWGKVVSALLSLPALLFPTGLSPLLLAGSSLVYGPTQVATGTLLQREFTDEQRATMGSINSFGGRLLFGVVSVLLGMFADRLGARTGLLILQIAALLRLWCYWRLRAFMKGKQSSTKQDAVGPTEGLHHRLNCQRL